MTRSEYVEEARSELERIKATMRLARIPYYGPLPGSSFPSNKPEADYECSVHVPATNGCMIETWYFQAKDPAQLRWLVEFLVTQTKLRECSVHARKVKPIVTFRCRQDIDLYYLEYYHSLSPDDEKAWEVQKKERIEKAKEEELQHKEEEDTPSSSFGDYGPGNPWDAPGMSVSDFVPGVTIETRIQPRTPKSR